LLPSALYLLELVNARTIPEKLVYALHLHFLAYFQGELHLRGRFIPGGVTSMTACDSHLTSPIVNKGESFDSSSFALGSEWCEKLKIPPCDKGSRVCTHMVEHCIL